MLLVLFPLLCQHAPSWPNHSYVRRGSVLSRGDTEREDGGWTQIHAYRQLKYARMLRELAVIRKNAELKSGSRGFQARKELLAFEKVVEDAKEKYASDLSSMKYAGTLTTGKALRARNLRWTPRNVRTS